MTKQEKIRRELYILTLGYFRRFNEEGDNFPNDTLCDEILSYLHSQGVVIRVERELPELKKLLGEATLQEKMAYLSGVKDYQAKIQEAGYVVVETLIEESK